MEKLGHMIAIDACFFDLNVILNHSNIYLLATSGEARRLIT